MIRTLYEVFRPWSSKGAVWILSDLHLGDAAAKAMDPAWPDPEEQVNIINRLAGRNDTFVCLGDVGDPAYAAKIRAGHKVLILGNHDRRRDYEGIFDEIYAGPLFISERILLSHEPVPGLPFCLNIHGHDHFGTEQYTEGCRYLNLAANVRGYMPFNLGKALQEGLLSGIDSIHRITIDTAAERKKQREAEKGKACGPFPAENE